jgi:RNA polymerase sigma-70 factor (ECF subfamily)
MQTQAVAATGLDRLDDGALVERARQRGGAAVRLIMQRHNCRLYRAARSILNDDAEAKDVVQEAYVRAFSRLDGFRGEAQLSTWLTPIALNEALGRLRRRRITVGLKDIDPINDQGEARVIYLPSAHQDSAPEAAASRGEVRRLLERAVDQLPDHFRVVFMLRDIEEMSVEETASQLGLPSGDGQDQAPSRAPSPARGPQQNPGMRVDRCFPMRRRTLCPDRRRRAGMPRPPRAAGGEPPRALRICVEAARDHCLRVAGAWHRRSCGAGRLGGDNRIDAAPFNAEGQD